ncbi:MAG: hypothetical protein H8E29_16515 [Anaerolineales bacterium]|uniref:Uncharacterized protein n=1 Tax=Candidatus Desulfolinea nitratireducens TaxID=2841698 RepID=A0A8J6NIC1_9CHLR|nr:hypothetical protein [Candidatus Desulfolinea nitratireducens]
MDSKNLWFEEELITQDEIKLNQDTISLGVSVGDIPHAVVRVQKPVWDVLNKGKLFIVSGQEIRLFKVKIGFEFDIPHTEIDKNYRFSFAKCSAFVWSRDDKQPAPWVFDIFPRELYEGEPQKISVKFSPEITVDQIGASIGEIGTEIALGQIVPTVIGFLGQDQRKPRWEIRPKDKMLLGIHYFWLVVAVPVDCEKIRLASQVEANLERNFGVFKIGPRNKLWKNRPSIEIG